MAVQASRKNPGRRGLAAASGAAEQVRMIDPISIESLHQWFGHLRLTDELRKRLGSVSSIKGSHHTVSLPGTHDQTWVEVKERLPAHPPEPSYPCYVSVLGELARLVPREEPTRVYR